MGEAQTHFVTPAPFVVQEADFADLSELLAYDLTPVWGSTWNNQ